jgi:DNA invertase Pin-like site-specific DNA recombinase
VLLKKTEQRALKRPAVQVIMQPGPAAELERVDYLAVHVQLELARGRVPDAAPRAFCEREVMTVVDVVADTKSGTVAPWDRRNLKPWVTEPEKMAMYDAVVAYKTDRWSRGTQEDFTRIEFWATQNGKRLIIVDGPQYPARADRFDADYGQWQAEKMAARREWELGRERVVRAADALRRENKFVERIP